MALGNLLQGYLAAKQGNAAADAQSLQQAGFLQKLMVQKQAAQKEQAFREALAALGPNPSQEALAGVASKFAPAQNILSTHTASLDRKAALDAARENREAARIQAEALQSQRIAEQQAAREQRASESEANRTQRMEELKLRLKDARIAGEERAALARELALMRADMQREAAAARGDKPMTEFQGKAALYGTRAAQSDKVLKALEDKISTAGLTVGQATGVLGNTFMSSEQRRVDQAQRDFVNAVLRQESGAVISDAEFANAKKQYFPQTGDDPNTLAQKRANRQLAIQGFARMAGPKGEADIKAIIDEPLLPGAPQQPSTSPKGSTYVEIRKTADGRRLGKKADGTIEEIR